MKSEKIGDVKKDLSEKKLAEVVSKTTKAVEILRKSLDVSSKTQKRIFNC